MNMWEQKLRDIFQAEKKNSGERTTEEMHVRFAELNMRDFFKHVVFPAYDDLKKEIEKYGRTVEVNVDDTGMNSASPRIRKVEILLRNGTVHEYDIENLTRQDIIECFVDEYSKWINY
ncbi:MAG: hypothetical protein CI953_75 [Methanohalophilus sp.]|nr:MAG: hypothetical protein CI953_75 [Methanohalophilus sp.]